MPVCVSVCVVPTFISHLGSCLGLGWLFGFLVRFYIALFIPCLSYSTVCFIFFVAVVYSCPLLQ